MHILHALFTHAMGGLEQAYLNITEALASRRHNVTALIHEKAPYRAQAGLYARTTHFEQPRGYYDLPAIWRIRRLVKSIKPDLILAHNARAITVLQHAARGTGIPVCGVSHSYKTSRLLHLDHLVVLTDDMRRHFITNGFPETRISVIPNLIHLPDAMVQHPFRAPPVIGAMGRMTPEKGLHVLIETLGELKRSGAAFRAVIAGDGPERPRLEAQAKQLGLDSCLHWEGWVNDVPAFMHTLDAFCLPSLEESFGIVLLQAFAAGVPVIASNAKGPAALITHQQNGLLVPVGDARAMASAIQQCLAHPDNARRIGSAGWEKVQEFGFGHVATQWDDTVNAIVKKSA